MPRGSKMIRPEVEKYIKENKQVLGRAMDLGYNNHLWNQIADELREKKIYSQKTVLYDIVLYMKRWYKTVYPT